MKCQGLFSLKNNKISFRMLPATSLCNSLRVRMSKYLMLSTMGKIISRQHFEIFFLIFPRKCRQHFEVFFLFFPENRIWHFMPIVSNLSSAELNKRMVKVMVNIALILMNNKHAI